MILPSRKDARYALAAILKGNLTKMDTTSVYPYQEDQIEGRSPVIRIMGSGRRREGISMRHVSSTFQFTIQLMVLFESKEDGWTSQNSEDKLDELSAEVDQVLLNPLSYVNGITGIESLQSVVRKDVVQGETFLIESIPIYMSVKSGFEFPSE